MNHKIIMNAECVAKATSLEAAMAIYNTCSEEAEAANKYLSYLPKITVILIDSYTGETIKEMGSE